MAGREREVHLVKDVTTGKLSVLPGPAHRGVDVQLHYADGRVEILTPRPQLILDQDATGAVTIRHQDKKLIVRHLTKGGPA